MIFGKPQIGIFDRKAALVNIQLQSAAYGTAHENLAKLERPGLVYAALLYWEI